MPIISAKRAAVLTIRLAGFAVYAFGLYLGYQVGGWKLVGALFLTAWSVGFSLSLDDLERRGEI